LANGAAEMKATIARIAARVPDVVLAALYQVVEEKVTICKDRSPVYVGPPGPGKPIPGVLRASIHQVGPCRDGRRVWTTIEAGGAAGAYAAVQHETLTFHHTVGQAKYIESVLLESRDTIVGDIAARVDLAKAAA
jgi:hypothetical protein